MTGKQTEITHIGVIGAGAWGTALASVAARAGRKVTLWAREPEIVVTVNRLQENRMFLPGIALDAAIRATSDLGEAATADALLLVTPAQHLGTIAAQLNPSLRPETLAAICAKGIEQGSNRLLTDVLAASAPNMRPAILSGPSFAGEVARGLPTAVTLACANEAAGMALIQALGSASFRPYFSHDLIGAQIGGAIKNVLAIAAGIVVGKKLGASAHAALTARGFAEMKRLGDTFGAETDTLSGLSGLGDLILTCGSQQSRNMSLGLALGEGKSLSQILGQRKSVTEGVYTATAIRDIARQRHIELPICEAVAAIVTEEMTVDDAIAALLSRPFKHEQE